MTTRPESPVLTLARRLADAADVNLSYTTAAGWYDCAPSTDVQEIAQAYVTLADLGLYWHAELEQWVRDMPPHGCVTLRDLLTGASARVAAAESMANDAQVQHARWLKRANELAAQLTEAHDGAVASDARYSYALERAQLRIAELERALKEAEAHALPRISIVADDTMGQTIPITQSRLFDLVRAIKALTQLVYLHERGMTPDCHCPDCGADMPRPDAVLEPPR